jgi:adenosylhomocysteine nucleosidase
LILLLPAVLRAESADVLLTIATDTELQPLVAKLGSPHTESLAAWQFWTGTLAGKKVVLTRTEGDPLNAVAATTLAIRHYAPKLVVTVGAARAHDPALQPGDVVVSKTFIAFDGLVSQPHALGEGIHPLTWEQLPHAMMTPGEKEHYQTDFPADTATLAVALKLTPPRGRIVAGALGSAPQVNREADRIAWIHQTWKTDCEDTESAHIAGCALLFSTPVIGLRIIDGAPAETPGLATQFLEALK